MITTALSPGSNEEFDLPPDAEPRYCHWFALLKFQHASCMMRLMVVVIPNEVLVDSENRLTRIDEREHATHQVAAEQDERAYQRLRA
jgi:hypothetical protein